MLCRNVKVEIFEETTVVLLQAAVNAWLEGRGEETLLDISFRNEGTSTFWAVVSYTEE